MESDEPLIPGDIVRLKSGGPNMMVERIMGEHILCMWFDDRRRAHASFSKVTLDKVPLG